MNIYHTALISAQFRDVLSWPEPLMGGLEWLPSTYVNEDAALYEDIVKGDILFCHNLGCIRSCCRIHGKFCAYRA